MRALAALLFLALLGSGCATAEFAAEEPEAPERQRLTAASLDRLAGTYEAYSYANTEYPGRALPLAAVLTSSDYWPAGRDTSAARPLARVTIRPAAPGILSIVQTAADGTHEVLTLGGALDERGFFVLEQRRRVRGIPFLFGSVSAYATRLGLSEGGDLVVDARSEMVGGVLLLLTGAQQDNRLLFARVPDAAP